MKILITLFILWNIGVCCFFKYIQTKENNFLKTKNNSLKADNKSLEQYNEKLKQSKEDYQKKIEDAKNNYDSLLFTTFTTKSELEHLKKQIIDMNSVVDNQKELSQKAFENYYTILETQYEKEENKYNEKIKDLESQYQEFHQTLDREFEVVKDDLDKIKATRAAAIQAQLKEKEIEENASFYCLKVSDSDLKDIAVLETIKPKLNKERILSMLIWSTFFQRPMTTLCNQVIGTSVKSGIYKITNLKTKECYIGQAADLASRFKQHAKCGLDIDTPAGNKLYKAMKEYGIWNFSWEVLEECPRQQLNEKEKYYIELYDSKNYGYNSISAPK